MRNIPIHLVIFIILLAFSGLSALYRKLRASQAAKQVRDLEEQRQLETLRTGRDPVLEGASNSGEDQRQRALAARREAQLAELRRRAQQRLLQQSHEPDPAPPPMAPPSLPQRAPQRDPQHAAGPSVGLARAAPRQTQRVQSQSQPLPAARAKAKQAGPSRVAPHAAAHIEDVVVAKAPSPVIQVNAPRTPEEWRRAIIANEIMSQPLAIREAPPSLPF